MTDWEALKTKSDIAVSWLSLVGVVAAVTFGYSEYRASVSNHIDDTERTTLDFIARYNQQGLLLARSNVQKSFAVLGSELTKQLAGVRALGEVNARSLGFFRENAADQLRKDENYADALLIVRFFDELLVCVDTGLCDKDSAEKFFTDEAYQYHFVLQAEIDRIQLTRHRFGLGLEQMRASAGAI